LSERITFGDSPPEGKGKGKRNYNVIQNKINIKNKPKPDIVIKKY